MFNFCIEGKKTLLPLVFDSWRHNSKELYQTCACVFCCVVLKMLRIYQKTCCISLGKSFFATYLVIMCLESYIFTFLYRISWSLFLALFPFITPVLFKARFPSVTSALRLFRWSLLRFLSSVIYFTLLFSDLRPRCHSQLNGFVAFDPPRYWRR